MITFPFVKLDLDIFTEYKSPDGYIYLRLYNHPVYGFKNIKRCKLVMENHLNRYLHPNEDVHHVDFDKTNDNIENLVVLTNSQHTTLHNYLDKFNITKLPPG